MLAFCRQLPRLFEAQQKSRWEPAYDTFVELDGQTLTIVGLGDVGCELAKRASSLGMRVIGVRRNANALPPSGVDKVLPVERLQEAFQDADQIVVSLPGGAQTRHLIDAEAISQMKSGVWLYSVGRGTTIDEAALIDALRSGHIACAGLDVFEQEPLAADNPLWQMPQVIITPHAAGYSTGWAKRFGRLVIDNVERFRTGQPLRNRISQLELAGDSQFCITSRERPE